MKHVIQIALVLVLFTTPKTFAQSSAPAGDPKNNSSPKFDQLADTALTSMAKRAEELKIQGVGLVAFIPGESVNSWSSKMVVVGKLKNAPTEKNRGSNLLGIAYSKAAEMADTLKDSGNAGRPPMTGETGWQGGLIKKCKSGYVLAAFSGGPSELDLKVSQAGLDMLADKF